MSPGTYQVYSQLRTRRVFIKHKNPGAFVYQYQQQYRWPACLYYHRGFETHRAHSIIAYLEGLFLKTKYVVLNSVVIVICSSFCVLRARAVARAVAVAGKTSATRMGSMGKRMRRTRGKKRRGGRRGARRGSGGVFVFSLIILVLTQINTHSHECPQSYGHRRYSFSHYHSRSHSNTHSHECLQSYGHRPSHPFTMPGRITLGFLQPSHQADIACTKHEAP